MPRINRNKVFWTALRVMAVAGAIALALAFALITGQISLPKRMVLQARIPHSSEAIELWERPDSYLGIFREYETWLVVRTPQETTWHLIDAQYVTFTDVTLYVSSDLKRVRVEVTGIRRRKDSHMIAEYDFAHKSFRAEDEPSVRGKKGWTVLAARHVR